MTDCLVAWSEADATHPWMVVDTHPGANALTDGAVSAAEVVVVPTILGMRELDALGQSLDELAAHKVIVVPMLVPPVPPRRLVDRLATMAQGRCQVAPPISEHRWLRRRLRRSALVNQPNPGVKVRAAAAEFRAVADVVEAV